MSASPVTETIDRTMFGVRENCLQLISPSFACSECGWDKDIRVLQIATKNANAKKDLAGTSKEKYYLLLIKEVLDNPKDHGHRVLCANCAKIRLLALQEKAKERRAAEAEAKKTGAVGGPVQIFGLKPVFLWNSPVPAKSCIMKHKWLDAKVEAGFTVYIRADEKIWNYPELKQVAFGWVEFMQYCGLPTSTAEPTEATTVYKYA